MGVVVADGAVDLAQQLDVCDLLSLSPQARDDVGHLLAQGGRRGRLAVGARQHGLLGVVVRQGADRLDDAIGQRQQDRVPPFAQHQRVGQVVDVFGGAGEVHELADLLRVRVLPLIFSLSRYSTALTS